jgi:hypothetical protein
MTRASSCLLEMPEHDSISVCVYNENGGLLELGQRINARFEDAYMNGYNWDALIRFYVKSLDLTLHSWMKLKQILRQACSRPT